MSRQRKQRLPQPVPEVTVGGKIVKLGIGLGMALLGALLAPAGGEPAATAGMGLVVIGGVLAFGALRDAIVIGLKRCGRNAEPGEVQVHLAAALMAVLAYAMCFDPSDERAHAVRWLVLLGLPASVYLFACFWYTVFERE